MCFDFDLFLHQTSDKEAGKILSKAGITRADVYVLEWGTGRIASSLLNFKKFRVTPPFKNVYICIKWAS